MSIVSYLDAITGRVFKILPMKEQELRGFDVYLRDYLSSLAIEMVGASTTFACLGLDSDYIAVVNTVNGLASADNDVIQIKREVFKALNLLNKIAERFGGEGLD